MTPSFSIIVPAYNAKDSLARAIASIKSQLSNADEIIIVDDGSADGTLAVAHSLSSDIPNLQVLELGSNKGRFQARKTGVEYASKDHILFLDADDAFIDGAFDQLREELAERDADILHFGMQVIDHSFSAQGARRLEEEASACPVAGDLSGDKILDACFNHGKYAWGLTNKCFRTDLCKKAISCLPDVHIRQEDSALICFAFAYFAKSYRGLSDAVLYAYNIGCGEESGRQIDLEAFESRIREAKSAYESIELFLSSVDHSPAHERAAQAVGVELASDCAQCAKDSLHPDERGTGYKALIKSWGPFACAALRKVFKYEELHLFKEKLFDESDCKRPDAKYIATYYRQLTGGGVEGVLRSTIKVWKSLGYKILLFSTGVANPDILKELEVDAYCSLPELDETRESTYAREAALCRALEAHDIDLVVYHDWVNEALPWDMITFKMHGVSFVVHCHGSFSFLASHANYRFASLPYMYSQADGIMCLSATDTAFWSMFSKNVFETINPPTFSCKDIQPVDPCLNGKNILWLARISPEKHPDMAVEAFEIVAQRIPDATLTLVGSASDAGYERYIDDLIAKSPAADRIRRCSWTDAQISFYASARLFLLTSHIEGYALALTESSTFGLPCVMFDLPYLTLVKDGRGILTAPFGDTLQLAELMCNVLNDDELCRSLGKDARQLMEDLASFDFASLWSEVFERSRGDLNDTAKEPGEVWETLLTSYAWGHKWQAIDTAGMRGHMEWLTNERDYYLEKSKDADKLKAEKEELRGKVRRLRKRVKSLQGKLKQYEASNSWKIGRAMTWLPRKAEIISEAIKTKLRKEN